VFPNSRVYESAESEIEEERRLCYVGLTRCKHKLQLTYARERRLYGTVHRNLPSRFLNEIPMELIRIEGMASFIEDQIDDPFPDVYDQSCDDSSDLSSGIIFD